MLGTPDPILADLSVWQDDMIDFSYRNFCILAQRYLGWFKETERSLYLVSLPLCELNNLLLPAQCREVIILLKEANKYAQDLCEQLNQFPRLLQLLSFDMILFTLHSVNDQSSNLIILINSYCANDTDHFPSYMLLKRKHIAANIKKLLTLIAEIPLQLKRFTYEREMHSRSSQSSRVTAPLDGSAYSKDGESRLRHILQQHEDMQLFEKEVSEDEDEFSQIIHLERYKNKRNGASDGYKNGDK